MYLTKLIKIKTEFIDKDPVVLVLEATEEQELGEFCLDNCCKLVHIIGLPGTLNKNTLLQVGIFEKDVKPICT